MNQPNQHTPERKSYQDWLARFSEVCQRYGGVQTIKPYQYRFETQCGPLVATLSELDYESETKRCFVSIYMKFSEPDRANTGKLPGDLNPFSGKWNIHRSGDQRGKGGAIELASCRNSAMDELVGRLASLTQLTAATRQEVAS